MARRLDHAVEGHELEDNQLPHSDLPKVRDVDQERVKNALKAGAARHPRRGVLLPHAQSCLAQVAELVGFAAAAVQFSAR
jgi:hypothetical protein